MLNRQEVEKLIKDNKLIENFINLDVQLTPNGLDLTVSDIFAFGKEGAVDFSNKERKLPECAQIETQKRSADDKFGWWSLKKGAYKVRTNEKVNLPTDLIALAYTRTTLLRIGAFTQHGVWDAGFKGRGEFILVVENPNGIQIKQNARIAQLIFTSITETSHGYEGIYKEE